MKQPTLDDLYVIGKPHEITGQLPDGTEAKIEVWLQKLDPFDTEVALRKANAAKARVLAVRSDHDSDEWLEMYADAATIDRETSIDYLIAEDVKKYGDSREAELAADPEQEWAKDDYLQGLRDAWEDGLKDRYADGTDDPDPEAQRVFDELKRFSDEVNEMVVAERTRLRRDFENVPDGELAESLAKRFLDNRAVTEWVDEFQRFELAYGVRDLNDHSIYYFAGKNGQPDIERVRRLQPATLAQLSSAYNQLVVAPQQGKGSPEAPASLQPSGLSGAEETAGESGLPAATP